MHEQTFDARDLLISYVPPGTVGAYGYTYNGDGQIATTTTPTGLVTFGYHATTGLLATMNGDSSTTFTHDAAGRRRTATRGNGNVNEQVIRGYDGPLLTSEQHLGSITGTLSLGYNHRHLRTTLGIAGATAALTYDDDDLVTSITGVGQSVVIERSVLNGRIEGVNVGPSVSEDRTFDPTFGELTSIATEDATGPLFNTSYTRDDLGRILTKTESVLSAANVTTVYTYDQAGRLETEKIGAAPTTTWLYDLNGTRQDAVVDGQDRVSSYLGSDYTYTYTNAGERRTKSDGPRTTTYDWDRLGNLLAVHRPLPATAIEYVYDGHDRRIGRKVGGILQQTWLYDGQLRIVAEFSALGGETKRFI
ncbi:MAG: RHS repeat protein, partial [Rhodococcus sp. (in: high G+C Gram-positive bacteria)]